MTLDPFSTSREAYPFILRPRLTPGDNHCTAYIYNGRADSASSEPVLERAIGNFAANTALAIFDRSSSDV
jgi:hypothetical protein